MKLTTKAILYYLLVSVPLLVIVSVMSYFSIDRAVEENLNEALSNDAQRARMQINTFKEPQNVILSFDGLSNIKIDSTNSKEEKFSTIYQTDAEDGELIEYKALTSHYTSKGTNYLITVVKPSLEKDDLIENLGETLVITIALLLVGFFVINWFVSKKLWKPFYSTILQLRDYDLKNHKAFEFEKTSTTEFKELNEAVQKMTNKIHKDFLAQKEFTENASHETQTPLAVIKARLDLLLQSPNLKEGDMKQLEIIEQAATKISSLNKSLLLLAKIGNNQFKEVQDVDLESVINKTLTMYEEILDSKNLTVNKDFRVNGLMKGDPILIDILISNLIQNAVRHNEEGGKVNIQLSSNNLIIANTGKPLNVEPEKLFERFRKNEGSKESIGLGLAIIKSILETYNYKFNYNFAKGYHTFTIEF